MTQTTNHLADINETISAITAHGHQATQDITRLHTMLPALRVEITELVDESDNNIRLRAEVELLEDLIQHDLRHRATTRDRRPGAEDNRVSNRFVDDLIATTIAYGNTRLHGHDTTALTQNLDTLRFDLDRAGRLDLFDAAVRYGLVRARRQISARIIRGTVDTIRSRAA